MSGETPPEQFSPWRGPWSGTVYHGTRPEIAQVILTQGFDPSLDKHNANSIFFSFDPQEASGYSGLGGVTLGAEVELRNPVTFWWDENKVPANAAFIESLGRPARGSIDSYPPEAASMPWQDLSQLAAQGFDGAVRPPYSEMQVFDPAAIKRVWVHEQRTDSPKQGCAHDFSKPVRGRRGSVATCLKCGVTKGKTAIVGLPTFYHVAPAHLRDEIAKQGLIGHLGEGTSSPWDERRKQWMTPVQQPAGNYLFSNLDDARDYAVQQGLTEHKLEHPDHYPYEHRIVPPEPPEDFHDWGMEDQDNWYEEHPGEEATGPHQLYNTYKGHDIWAVDPTGLHLRPDPEMALLHGEIPDEESAIEAIRDQSYGRDEDTPEGTNWQEWEYQGGRSPDRWMTPEYVPPEAIQHHEWVPPWAANEEESMNRLEEYGDRQLPQKSPLHERETPEPFHQMPQRPLPDWSEG